MTILVDSDILIEVSRGRDTAILARWAELSESDDLVLCSPVSVAELWHGARKSEYDALSGLFRSLTCTPLDGVAGQLAGDYLRQYRASHGLELGDALTAAAATTHSAALWTRNRRHYPMPGLKFY